jgi:hypothetical protein
VKLSHTAPVALALLLSGCPVPVVMDVAYDLGYALSGKDGSFRILAAPERLLNVSDPDDHPALGIFAVGYNTTWLFKYPSQPSAIQVRLKQLDSHATVHDPCLPVPFTWQTCKLIREHLHLTESNL